MTIQETITLGGTAILQVDAAKSVSGSAPFTRGTIAFGGIATGIRQFSFYTTDGHVLRGEVDGRPIVPFLIGADPKTIQFQDGQPPPTVAFQPGILQALEALSRKAREEAGECRPATPFPRITSLDTGNTGRSDHVGSTPACISCEARCTAVATLGAASCCAFTLGFGCAACVAAAVVAEIGCIGELCHGGGQPCCPVTCGDVACCYGGDTCLDTTRGVCCGPGLNPCNGHQCCQRTDLCLPDGTCCPQGQAVCNQGTVCCQPGEACSTEGICCPQFQQATPPISCRGACCAADEVCKDGVACCPPSTPVCNGVCCRGGTCDNNGDCCLPPGRTCAAGGVCCAGFSACCLGQCCPGPNDVCHPTLKICCAEICGPACCGPNQFCQDRVNGICGTCPPGQYTCPVAGEPRCCPVGTDCCPISPNGQCCPPGTCCCFRNGAWTCCPGSDPVCTPR